MLYQLFEFSHAAVKPARAAADVGKLFWQTPLNPFAETPVARNILAKLDMFERATRRYERPEFGIDTTKVDGRTVAIEEQIVWQAPFCNLLHFQKEDLDIDVEQPKLLIVAPLSGHFSTLLRGTVEALLPEHDVYITDWVDARQVSVVQGEFSLDTYIDYLIKIFKEFNGDCHVMAVCQPSVPVLGAVSLMSEAGSPDVPRSMTLMGGPIDTRINPTAVNRIALERGLNWFRNNVIVKVPFPNPGFSRKVYPGFLQLTGFMAMNLDRHVQAHRDMYRQLIKGDGSPAQKHKEFYDEYMSVMDLTAEFYLQTVKQVFIEHQLPRGVMKHRRHTIDLGAIEKTALLTIEGEKDDISGVGQTFAAHDLCRNLDKANKKHYLQPEVGHYGVFNGRRFREEIVPQITSFIRSHDRTSALKKATNVIQLRDKRRLTR